MFSLQHASPCEFCRSKETGAKAFLLTCSLCSVSWHHNCHTPALSNVELIALLKASNRDESSRVQGVITIDDSDDDVLIIEKKPTLPNLQGEPILDLTMLDDDSVSVEIKDNSPIVIDSDLASIRGSSLPSPSVDIQQQILGPMNQRSTENHSPVNPFIGWLDLDNTSHFAVETERAWLKRKTMTSRTQRPRKSTTRKLDTAANDTFFFTNL
ncbi:hypothetical protein AB1N83_004316 [Pleurotus pulmonarius]